MNDISDLSSTIKPKSDQLNADDLLTGPMNVIITDIKSGPPDQPVHIYIEGQQPYKPCKTMRRVLITAWGSDGKAWVGKSMTLYCDPDVKFGGIALGGIRISHLSHIDKALKMMLTATRGRKSRVVVQPLIIEAAVAQAAIAQAGGTDRVKGMITAFNGIGINGELLKQIAGKPLTALNGDDFVKLTGIYRSMKDGATNLSDYIDGNLAPEKKESKALKALNTPAKTVQKEETTDEFLAAYSESDDNQTGEKNEPF